MADEGKDPKYLEYLQKSIQKELSRRLSPKAEVLTTASEDFESVNRRFTQWHRPTYIAGVKVFEEQDVVETVNYARSRGIGFAARSGGHCVTNSMRTLQDGIVIDMRGLNKLDFNAELRQVTVAGGVTTGDFANFVHSHGMEVTVGSCPATGIFGVSFGAGIGRLQGKYGYLNDNMVSARLVLANGTIVRASDTENTDLFWAIRGAGHNFGIGIEATFQVYPQAHGGIHHNFDIEFGMDKLEAVFEKMNDLAPRMPADLAIFVCYQKISKGGPRHQLLINAVWSGADGEEEPYIAEFLAIGPNWSSGKMTTTWDILPWITYHGRNKILSTEQVWKDLPIKMFCAASVKQYHIPTMKSYFSEIVRLNDEVEGKPGMVLFGPMFESFPHQRVREIPDEKTAYPWRQGTDVFLMLTISSTTMEGHDYEFYEEHLERAKQAFVDTSGYGRLQQYVNYGHGTSNPDPVEALYGYEPWRLEKLRRLKKIYDPEGMFNWYQPFV